MTLGQEVAALKTGRYATMLRERCLWSRAGTLGRVQYPAVRTASLAAADTDFPVTASFTVRPLIGQLFAHDRDLRHLFQRPITPETATV